MRIKSSSTHSWNKLSSIRPGNQNYRKKKFMALYPKYTKRKGPHQWYCTLDALPPVSFSPTKRQVTHFIPCLRHGHFLILVHTSTFTVYVISPRCCKPRGPRISWQTVRIPSLRCKSATRCTKMKAKRKHESMADSGHITRISCDQLSVGRCSS